MKHNTKIIDNILRERHSTYPRNFKQGEKIPKQVIESILENATWAPTHKLTQPWQFIVFEGDGIKTFFKKQAEIYQEITPMDKVNNQKLQKYKDKTEQVSHVIAIIAKHDTEERIPEIEEVVATSCAIQNIYLSLSSYGIAGYLSTGDVCYTEQMEDFLDLEKGDKVLGFFQLGIASDDLKPHPRKRITAKEKTVWKTH